MNRRCITPAGNPPPNITGVVCDIPSGQLFKSDWKADSKAKRWRNPLTLHFKCPPFICSLPIWVRGSVWICMRVLRSCLSWLLGNAGTHCETATCTFQQRRLFVEPRDGFLLWKNLQRPRRSFLPTIAISYPPSASNTSEAIPEMWLRERSSEDGSFHQKD